MAPEDKNSWYKNLRVELDPERLDEELRKLREKLGKALEQGRYTRVRFKYKGKPILPDIPLAALVATEVVSFWWAGPLRALVLNLGVKTLVEVEFIHAAGEKVGEAQEHFLNGDVEEAEALYREALRIKPGDPSALYHLGVLLKVTGKKPEARQCFERAAQVEDHPDSARAREALGKLS